MVVQICPSTSARVGGLMPLVLAVIGVALISMVVQVRPVSSTTVSSSTRHFNSYSIMEAILNVTTLFPLGPSSAVECTGDLSRNSCDIDEHERVKRNAIAGIRMAMSVLSIGGSLSIISSAIYRRTYRNPKVLPIFILSIADFLLACTWIVGGTMWFAEVSNRSWCFVPSLLTVILVCICANLTLVYAWASYDNLKEKSFSSILAHSGSDDSAWHPYKSLAIYSGAWLLPLILIILGFGSLEGVYKLLHRIQNCSCWCVPYFGNVVPLAYEHDQATAYYSENTRYVVAIYGYVVGTNYLVVFILLVIIYWKILRWIRVLRRQNRSQRSQAQYGGLDIILLRSETQARRRVIYFLTVFTITGFANLFLGYTFAIYESVKIYRGDWHIHTGPEKDHLSPFVMTIFTFQSITVPLQGFLNALVYGWTRQDFIYSVMHRRATSGSHFSDDESERLSGSYRSSIMASRALGVNGKGFSISKSYRSFNSASGKFK